jgi:Fic/DOC family
VETDTKARPRVRELARDRLREHSWPLADQPWSQSRARVSAAARGKMIAMPMTVHYLRWCDVDPAGRAFDPGPARRIAEGLILGAKTPPPVDALQVSIDRAFLAEYGAWASGWTWATSEPGGGGPVRGWCCARDSLFRKGDRDASASVDRVVAALSEWRAFLEALAVDFAALHQATAGLSIDEGVERAAGRLLPLIVERTGAEDAWYATFERVLGWYLESAGHDPEAFRDAVRGVVSGRFASWVEPDADTARTACTELGYEVALTAAAAPATRDALAAWRGVRARAFQNVPGARSPEPVRADGHRRYIEGPERTRDPRRAERMARALDACRASARRDHPLTFERLAAWQAIVLGAPAAFRSTDAHAKHGRERYPLDAETRPGFVAALEEANAAGTPVSVRAARVYLDVCFYHPFDDGNARAARLALDHVVTRAGLTLHAVEPLFVVAPAAGDRDGAASLAWLVEYLLGR